MYDRSQIDWRKLGKCTKNTAEMWLEETYIEFLSGVLKLKIKITETYIFIFFRKHYRVISEGKNVETC